MSRNGRMSGHVLVSITLLQVYNLAPAQSSLCDRCPCLLRIYCAQLGYVDSSHDARYEALLASALCSARHPKPRLSNIHATGIANSWRIPRQPKHHARFVALARGSRAAMQAPARRHRTKFDAPRAVAALVVLRSVSNVLLICSKVSK